MRNPYVSIGEAARIAGVSVDTLRRLDDAGVYKDTIRTAGGQRRFSVEELERVRDGGTPPEEDTLALPLPEAPRARVVQPWEAREAEALADVAVTRARIARREDVRRYREAEAAREAAARAQAEARVVEARERRAASARREQAQRDIDSLVSLLRIRMISECAAAKAEFAKLLAERAHPGVSLAWLEAEVGAIRERHAREKRDREQREDKERQREQAERDAKAREEGERLAKEQRKKALISRGEWHASIQTLGSDWDVEAALEARDEVKGRLEAEVGEDWTERDVDDLVADVLSEWEP